MSSSNDKPTPFTSDSPLSLVRPSWADPSYVAAACYTRRSVYTLPAGIVTPIAAPNPRRIAIIFPGLLPSPLQTSVGIFSGGGTEFLVAIGQEAARFTIFDWFTAVTDGWVGYSATGATDLPLYEILTQ